MEHVDIWNVLRKSWTGEKKATHLSKRAYLSKHHCVRHSLWMVHRQLSIFRALWARPGKTGLRFLISPLYWKNKLGKTLAKGQEGRTRLIAGQEVLSNGDSTSCWEKRGITCSWLWPMTRPLVLEFAVLLKGET